MDWNEKAGVVQVVNYYEETRNSPPRLQLFEDRFAAYRVEGILLWIKTPDGAEVAYPVDKVNQLVVGDDVQVEDPEAPVVEAVATA